MANSIPYFDISPIVNLQSAVFPGDTPFQNQVALSFELGHHLHLSSIHTTLHIGAHADAPLHYTPNAEDISQRSLHYYLGSVQVIEVKKNLGTRITPRDLDEIPIKAPRVLFKTSSFTNPNQWSNQFVSCSAELIDYLAQQDVCLVGIDTPSIDLADCKILESHQAISRNNMAILEGLYLENVHEGLFTLIALPLKIAGAEAAPVRAVLLPKDVNL